GGSAEDIAAPSIGPPGTKPLHNALARRGGRSGVLTLEEIRLAADYARSHAPMGMGRIQVSSICDALGIRIELLWLRGDALGALVGDGRHWMIIVNQRTNRSESRRRFTIAHELGHYMLHRELSHHFLCSPRDRSRMEREANYFAAELLMPSSEIRLLHLRGIGPQGMADALGDRKSVV